MFDGGSIAMDNLNAQGAGDQFHGIYAEGPGDGLEILNPSIEWIKRPTRRTQGEGIRLHGFPSDVGCLRNVRIINSIVRSSPQAGLLIVGCSDVRVDRHLSDGTLADGCHVNASQHVALGLIRGSNTGDDACAFVTYLLPTVAGVYGNDKHDPFGVPGYGPFSNSQCSVDEVMADGGRASGLRLAQSNVRVGAVIASGKEQAVIADGGMKGRNFAWSNLQPFGCEIGSINATNCKYGLHVRSFNNALAGGGLTIDPRLFTVGLRVGTLDAHDCASAMTIVDVAGLQLMQARLGGEVDVRNIRNCSFGDVEITNAHDVSIDPAARQQFRRLVIHPG